MNLTIEEPGWETFIPIVNLSKRPPLTETNEIFLAQILNLTMRELDNRGVCPQSIKDIYASDVLLALDGEDSIQDIQYDGHKYLVKSGIWRGMFDSKGLSASYIKSMGSTIYSQIASKAELSSVADRFRNISHNFADL